MKDTLPKILLNWLAVLIWLAVIYYFSAQSDLKSELEPFWDMVFRKIVHISEFFVLAYLFFRALSGYKLNYKNLLLVACLLSLAYAGFDEWHQSMVAGRTASIIDVGIDGIGILAFTILHLLQKPREND